MFLMKVCYLDWGWLCQIKVARRSYCPEMGINRRKSKRDDGGRVHRQQLLRLRFNLHLDEENARPRISRKVHSKLFSGCFTLDLFYYTYYTMSVLL